MSVQSFDATEFWTLALDKYVRKIRRDFERLYAEMSHKMTAYYETQMEKMQTHVKQVSHYQRIEFTEELTRSQQTLEVQYAEAQESFSYERELLTETEATFGK